MLEFRWIEVSFIFFFLESAMNIYYLLRPGPNNDVLHPFPPGLRVSRLHHWHCSKLIYRLLRCLPEITPEISITLQALPTRR